MSGYVYFTRPGQDPLTAEAWEASSGLITWLLRELADRVDNPSASARLAQAVEADLGWLAFASYDDEEASALVRVIRELPTAVPDTWPASTVEHLRDLVARSTRWAQANDLS